MQSQRLDLTNWVISYKTAGEGPALLFIHGAFQDNSLWDFHVEALSPTFSIVTVDLKGIGKSESKDKDFTLETVARGLAKLMHELGHRRYGIIGHDLGAAIGVALADQEQRNVSRLMFLDMVLPGFGFEDAWVPRPEGRFLWFGALNAVPGVLEDLFAERVGDYFRSVLRGGFTANKTPFSDEKIANYAAAYAGAKGMRALSGYFLAMWKNAEYMKTLSRRKLTIPCLAIGGQFSVGEASRVSLAAVSEHVEGRIASGVGHWIPDEAPEFLIEEIQSFFKPLRA